MEKEPGSWRKRLGEGVKGLGFIHLAIAVGAFALGYTLVGDVETLLAGGHYFVGDRLSKSEQRRANTAGALGKAALAAA